MNTWSKFEANFNTIPTLVKRGVIKKAVIGESRVIGERETRLEKGVFREVRF